MSPINPINDYRPVYRFNPIGEMLEHCSIEHMPAHLQYALTTPPEGHCAQPANKDCHPNGSELFRTVIPRNTDDAEMFIRHARFPHKSYYPMTDFLREHFNLKQQGLLALSAAACTLIGAITLEPGHVITLSSSIITAIIGTILTATTLGIIVTDFRNEKRGIKDPAAKPTREMQQILSRGIPVARTTDMADQAWNIYCYDHDNYNEFADLYAYMNTINAKTDSDTYVMQKQILDTWVRTSLLRQEVAKKELNEHINHAEQLRLDTAQHEREIESVTDQFQTQFLREAFLEPLQEQERATREIYTEKDNVLHD